MLMLRAGLLMIAACSLLCACASRDALPAEKTALRIQLAFSPPNTCRVAFGGHEYTMPAQETGMLVSLKQASTRFKRAILEADWNTVPFKCFGAAMFTAQRAGFEVSFYAEPPRPEDLP